LIQVASNYPVRGNLKLRTAINDILNTYDQMTEELEDLASGGNHSKKDVLNFGKYVWYIKRLSDPHLPFPVFYDEWSDKEGRNFDITNINFQDAAEIKAQKKATSKLLNKKVDEAKIRFSKARARMLVCIYEINDVFTVLDLRRAVKDKRWPMSVMTFYSNIQFFVKEGIITEHPKTYTANKFEVE